MAWIDGITLCAHLLATFVIYNYLMFITIALIRVPRLILHVIQAHSKSPDLKNRMMAWIYNFRLWSLIAFPITSLIVQYVIIFKQFCTYYKLENKKNHC